MQKCTFATQMEKLVLHIPPTRHTPKVTIDRDWNISIAGACFPENAFQFFEPLEEHLNTLDPNETGRVKFLFRMEFMNTLSSKALLDHISRVINQKQIVVEVEWQYYADDEEMREHGEVFSEIMNIPFHFVSVDPSLREEK